MLKSSEERPRPKWDDTTWVENSSSKKWDKRRQ